MKTRNTFRKTVSTLTALGFTLILFTNLAGAQGFGNGSDDNGTKSRAKTQSSNTVSAASYAAELEARKRESAIFNMVTANDPELYIQQWMVDRRNFVRRPGHQVIENKEPENTGEVSDSMAKTISALLIVEEELPLKIEAWMTDEKCFPCESRTHHGGYYTMK